MKVEGAIPRNDCHTSKASGSRIDFHTEFMGNATKPTSSSDKGKGIGLTAIGDIVYRAMYADASTEEEPIVKVGDYEVHINDVDPDNATKIEMFALLSYMDDKGLTDNSGICSFGKMLAYASQAEYNGFCSGIADENAAWSTKRNWIDILNNAKETFLGIVETYGQAINIDKMTLALQKWMKEGGLSL